jgi:hypothetical protein
MKGLGKIKMDKSIINQNKIQLRITGLYTLRRLRGSGCEKPHRGYKPDCGFS